MRYAIPEGPASAQALALGTEHKCGVTETLDCFWRPTAIDGGTKSLCERPAKSSARPGAGDAEVEAGLMTSAPCHN